jgi:hypothetical protein
VDVLFVDRPQRKAVQPDAGLVAAGAEGDLQHRLCGNCGWVGKGEVPLVPRHDLVLRRRRRWLLLVLLLLLDLGRRHVRLDGAWPDGGIGVLVPDRPAVADAAIVEVEIEAPLAIEQLVEVVPRDRARERILRWREIRWSLVLDDLRRGEVH